MLQGCASCHCSLHESFYRCFECSQFSCRSPNPKTRGATDFCEACFKQNLHDYHRGTITELRGHHFLKPMRFLDDDVVCWAPCVRPQTMASIGYDTARAPRATSQSTLRNKDWWKVNEARDKQDEGVQVLINTLVESLPTVPRSPKNHGKASTTMTFPAASACWCGSSTTVRADVNALKTLPCRHTIHRQCLLADLTQLAKDCKHSGTNLAEYRCKHTRCNQQVFVSLIIKDKLKGLLSYHCDTETPPLSPSTIAAATAVSIAEAVFASAACCGDATSRKNISSGANHVSYSKKMSKSTSALRSGNVLGHNSVPRQNHTFNGIESSGKLMTIDAELRPKPRLGFPVLSSLSDDSMTTNSTSSGNSFDEWLDTDYAQYPPTPYSPISMPRRNPSLFSPLPKGVIVSTGFDGKWEESCRIENTLKNKKKKRVYGCSPLPAPRVAVLDPSGRSNAAYIEKALGPSALSVLVGKTIGPDGRRRNGYGGKLR